MMGTARFYKADGTVWIDGVRYCILLTTQVATQCLRISSTDGQELLGMLKHITEMLKLS